MLAPRDLDHLLDDCAQISLRLSSGARRTLRHFLRLRKRHGERTVHVLSADDIELLEDWAATACRAPVERESVPRGRSARSDAPASRGRAARPRPSRDVEPGRAKVTLSTP